MADAARSDAPSAPFPGIKPFSYAYRHVFFARQDEIRALMRLVVLYRGVLVYGASQRGKSSLLNAGFIPEAIRNGYQPERIRVQPRRGAECVVDRIVVSTSGGVDQYMPSIFDAHGATDVIVLSLHDMIARVREVATLPGEPPAAIAVTADQGAGELPERPATVKPLLIFDQFEEWITAFEDAQVKADHDAAVIQSEILREITSLINDHQVRAKVVLTFREDYLPRLDPFFDHCPTLSDHYLRLAPLPPRRLYKLIRGPFMKYPGRYPTEIAPALARTIQRQFVENDPEDVSLTEMQIVCRSLVENPELAALLGPEGTGVRGILQQYFRSRLGLLAEDRREPAVALLSCLVSSAGTRKTVDREHLITVASAGSTEPRALFLSALDDLEREARLVRRERRRDLDYFEISSEFLVDWIKEQAAARLHREEQRRLVAEREQAEAQAREMRERLEEQTRRAKAEAAAAEATRNLLVAETLRVRAEAEVRGQERLKRWAALVAMVFMALFAVTVVATISAVNLAREHQSRLWIQAAGNQLTRDPQLSTLLGLWATESATKHELPTLPAAQMVLARAVRAAAHLRSDEPLKGAAPVISPDGRRLALIVDGGQRAQLRDGPYFENATTIEPSPGKKIEGLAFFGGGANLVMVNSDGSFDLLDAANLSVPRRSADGPGVPAPKGEPADNGQPGRAVERWALDSGRGRLIIGSRQLPGSNPQWPSGGRWVSVADVRARAWLGQSPMLPLDTRVAISEDGRRYAVVSSTGAARVMDAGGALVSSRRFDPGTTVDISPDGSHLLAKPLMSAAAPVSVSVWRIGPDAPWVVLLPGRELVRMASFAPDSRALAVVQEPGVLQLWDLATRKALYSAPIQASGLAFSPDSSAFLAWHGNDLVELWGPDPKQGRLRLVGHEEAITFAAVAPGAGPIVTTTASRMRVWSRTVGDRSFPAGGSRLAALAMSPDGSKIATGGADSRLAIIDVATGTTIASVPLPADARVVEFSHHGEWVVAGLENGAVAIAQPSADRSSDRLFDEQAGPVTALTLSRDGQYLAYAIGSAGRAGKVLLRNVQTGQLASDLERSGHITSIALSGDRKSVVVGVYEPAQYPEPPTVSFEKLDFNRTPTRGSSAPAQASSSRPAPPQAVPAGPRPPDFARDEPVDGDAGAFAHLPGRITAISDRSEFGVSVDPGGRLESWMMPSRRQVLEFGDQAEIVAVDHDGRFFAVASGSGLMKLYTAGSLLEPVVLQEIGPRPVALAFNEQGDRLASLRADGVVTVFDFGARRLLDSARSIAARRPQPTLTEQECAQASLDSTTCSAATSAWQVLVRRVLRSTSER